MSQHKVWAQSDEEEQRMIQMALALSLAEQQGNSGAPPRPGGVLSSFYPSVPPMNGGALPPQAQPYQRQYPPPQPAPQQHHQQYQPHQPYSYPQYPGYSSVPPGGYSQPPNYQVPSRPAQYPQHPQHAQHAPVSMPPSSNSRASTSAAQPQPSRPLQPQPQPSRPSQPQPQPPRQSQPQPQPPRQSQSQPQPQASQGGLQAPRKGQQAPPPRRLYTNPNACAGCGGALAGKYLEAMKRLWHPACFVCGFCSQPVNQGGNSNFAIGTDGWPYHMDCFKHQFHPVCSICQQFIPEKSDGRVEYKEQAFWRQIYCTTHAHDGTPQCCSCSRFQAKGTEFAQLSDGRYLCLTCIGSVVVDTKDVQPLYEEVLAFYKSMGMPHPQRAPLMAVDGVTLNDMSNREGKSTSGGPVFHIRGLTLATVYRTITTVLRSGGGGLGVSSVATPVPTGPVQCSVSAILVLYGLPRLLTGCIVAHELMHAWLRMRNVAGLDPKVEEGLCQLMAYVWLEQQHEKVAGDEAQARLASFFAYQIREDTSEVYGDGFREALEAFQQRGLSAVINDVLRHGRIA